MQKLITAAIISGVVIIIGVTLYFTVFKKRNTGGDPPPPDPPPPVKCAIQNTTYVGDDIGFPITITGNSVDAKVTKCQQYCAKDPNCNFWTFYTNNDECYKKLTNNITAVNDDAVSGPKVCPN